jgi:hypothetical protein
MPHTLKLSINFTQFHHISSIFFRKGYGGSEIFMERQKKQDSQRNLEKLKKLCFVIPPLTLGVQKLVYLVLERSRRNRRDKKISL